MFDYADINPDYGFDSVSNVDMLERAGEAIGQMATGSHSALLWCPRCHGSNRMMITERLSGIATNYLCTGCGAEVKAEDL